MLLHSSPSLSGTSPLWSLFATASATTPATNLLKGPATQAACLSLSSRMPSYITTFNFAQSVTLFFFFFLWGGGQAHGTRRFPGQGSNPNHSSDLSHSSDNAGSLTHRATRELPNFAQTGSSAPNVLLTPCCPCTKLLCIPVTLLGCHLGHRYVFIVYM